MTTPQQLLNSLRARSQQQREPVAAYWFAVSSDRDLFRSELAGNAPDLPLIVHVVRERIFENANALMPDLISVLDSHRKDILSTVSVVSEPVQHWMLVILGRTPLTLSNAGSPATLPEWFPVFGGQTIYVSIEDLSKRVDAPLNAADLRLGQLCGAIFDSERLMIRRLEHVRESDHNAVNPLWAFIQRDTDSGFHDFLSQASRSLAQVLNPEAYRPSVRSGTSLTSRLWSATQTIPVERHGQLASALAKALQLPQDCAVGYASILAVLSRPTTPDTGGQRIARSMLVTLASICQLATAAAHADEYCAYPLPLMDAVAADLYTASLETQTVLLRLDPMPPRRRVTDSA